MSERLICFGNAYRNEDKVLRCLDESLPPEYKILANLRINDSSLGEVEYDVIVLGKYAAYVIEIKNYGGLIKGDARSWEVQSKNNKSFSIPNPFLQLGKQVSIFVSRLKEVHNKVLVQGFVCLSSETQPVLNIQDSESHLKSIFWYKDAAKFLTNPAAITLPESWGRKNIESKHEPLIEAIRTGFSPRKIENVPGYTIESDAWTGRRYKAYFAKREKVYPPKVLLKIYDVPEVVSTPEEIKRFVDELNTRDFYALRKIEKTGDQKTGGQNYVLAGEAAFVHPLRSRSYIVAMEWVNGRPLFSYITHPENFTFQVRCLIAAQICRGLAFIHSANVVHRNLSLDNIVWSSDENKVKIINFDFAKFTDDAISTVEDQNVLALMQKELQEREKYQAPELRPGNNASKDEFVSFTYHHANRSTDIYALGIVLLELFTGIVRPNTDTVKEHLSRISDYPEVRKFIEACGSDSPTERPGSLTDAAQMFDELSGVASPAYDLVNLPSGYRLGIYAIASQIGRSRMSVVYRAENTWSKQQVVIKIPRTPSRENAQEELLRAAQILDEIPAECTARLLHTDMAFLSGNKMHKDWSPDSKEVYYQVWEHINGQDLKFFLLRNKPDLEARIKIVLQVLKVVALLHERGWIHKDIKPENFMATPDGQIKIIDFGLTKRTSEIQGDQTGGTPGCYLPPEILNPEGEWTQAGDVWSLGCLALVVLFGEEVCTGGGPLISWEEVEQKFNSDAVRMLKKATDINPTKRYLSAQEFLGDFEKIDFYGLNQVRGKAAMDYQNVLEQLKEKRDEALSFGNMGEAGAIENDIRTLQKWLEGGQKGDCPVDLSAYQIRGEVKEPVTESPDVLESDENVDVERVAVEEADHAQETLRLELEQVRQHIKKKQWREAVARATQVEAVTKGDTKEVARDLLSQAQTQLTKELEKRLADGDAARAKNNSEKAQEHYRAALDLDPSNAHARLALQELDGRVQEKVSKEQQDSLRSGLNDRRDIHRLGEAVYDAEALDGEGKLPAKLVPLLKEARDYYDQTRRSMGEDTTAMRYGDIAMRADAVAKIQARVASGAKTIYDQTTDTDRTAFDVLREAQVLLQQASEDTAQYEINIAEKFKALRPRYVHQRLSQALQQPFYEQEKRKLEEKLGEVDQYIQAQEKSESLQTQALHEADPVRKLGILLQASQTFAGVAGLSEQIAQTHPIAVAMLHVDMSDALQRAELFIRNQEYTEARSATNEAESQAAKWPEKNLPEEITKLLAETKALRQRIDGTENAWKEYTRLASDIRQKVMDQNQRASSLLLFKRVSQDERFQSFSDLKVLTSEIDQYKDVGDQLNDAATARDKNDWSRAFEIADKVLKAGTAGKLATRFQELHADAVTELNILRAQELLESDEIPEANNILSATLNKERERGLEREKTLRSRLSIELDRIQQAIEGNKPMQELYDRAASLLGFRDSLTFKAFTSPSFALRQARVGAEGEVNSPDMRALINRVKDLAKDPDPSPQELTERVGKLLLAELSRKGVHERLNALKLFRYVGGDQAQAARPDWPPYALSLRKAEARRAARLLTESLHTDVLVPLVEKYTQYQDNEHELRDEVLRNMAKDAEALREAYLLQTESERAVGRWVEVEWGKRLAQYEEKGSNWQTATEIWGRLDNQHPGIPVVKRGLRNARIHSSINRAYYLVHNDHKGEEALTLLRDLQHESEMSNSWELHLALADTYEALGEFESAFGNLDQAERVIRGLDDARQTEIRSQIEQRRVELERQEIIYTCSEMAQSKMPRFPAEAIRILQAGMENPNVGDPTPLRVLRDDIFDQASQELLQKTREEQDKGSDEGKIQAVMALVDLQTLEELIGQPEHKRRSNAGLERLRADLTSVADAVILAARDFDPTTMPLTQAIDTAAALSARLQTFDNVIPLFKEELEQVGERLTRRRREIATVLENLRDLENTLMKTNDQNLWRSAITTGDFAILEQYLTRIHRFELNAMQEVRTFEKRLAETQEVYRYLLGIIGQIRYKFSVEEDFGFVKDKILGSKVQPPFRENDQSWQAVHAKEYDEVRNLLDDHLRVPDIYGRGDLVGWQKVLEQADVREKELELWQEWDRKCAYRMDAADQAVRSTEMHADNMPTRNKKMDWEKVLTTSEAAIAALSYPHEQKFTDLANGQEKTSVVLVVGTRDARDVPVPIRSKAVKNIEEEGKRRKQKADEWLHEAQMQIAALQAVLDQRGFPSPEEFNRAAQQKDQDALEKLLVRAREAGITNESERKRVETYSRVLEQWREQHKNKGWWSRRR